MNKNYLRQHIFLLPIPNPLPMIEQSLPAEENEGHFKRSLSLLDGALLVIGSMIGSGIFITSAEMTRTVGSAGWLLIVWTLSGVVTIIAALSYGELSGMFPKAGGQYVYLREAFGEKVAFLYGWSFFAVIQTGTIAAVAVAFAKYTGYLVPFLGEGNILVDIGVFKVSAAQLLAIGSIILLTMLNSRGVREGKWIQFVFTFTKVAALAALIILGFWVAQELPTWKENIGGAWTAKAITYRTDGAILHQSLNGWSLFAALGVAMVGALFSSDAWNGVTFIAGEIKHPQRNIGLSLFLGTLTVTIIYVACNFMYVSVLTTSEIAAAPYDRVAVAASQIIMGNEGAKVIAIMIMVSTFGCNNGLIMAGARVYFKMAKDRLFIRSAGHLNKAGVPAKALWMQCGWASVLCLSGHYNDLLNFIIFTVLLFYIFTIGGIFVLRRKMPDVHRPYKAFGYPVLPAIYIIIAAIICCVLLYKQTFYAGMGLLIVLIGLPVYAYFQRKQKR